MRRCPVRKRGHPGRSVRTEIRSSLRLGPGPQRFDCRDAGTLVRTGVHDRAGRTDHEGGSAAQSLRDWHRDRRRTPLRGPGVRRDGPRPGGEWRARSPGRGTCHRIGHERRGAAAGRHRRVVGDDRRGGQGQPGGRAHHGHRRSGAGDLGVIPATGVGSGVIFNSNGWILTNHHVVEGGDKFDVELKDGRVLTGTVYGIDTLTDLRHRQGRRHRPADRRDRRVGRAQGRPARRRDRQPAGHLFQFGDQRDRVGQGSLDHHRRQPVADQPHPDGRGDQPRQLGRPAARCRGNVVGINTAIASNSNGIGFAIPIDIARPIMDQASPARS